MSIPELRKLIANQNGVAASFDGSTAAFNDLPTDTKQSITAGMLNYIRANPGQFTPQQVGVAQSAPNSATLGQVDTSFDYGEFFDELENNAVNIVGTPLADIGNNVSNTVSLLAKLIPWVAVGALLVFAAPYIADAVRKSKV